MEKVIIEGKEYWENQIWKSDNDIDFVIKIIRKSVDSDNKLKG